MKYSRASCWLFSEGQTDGQIHDPTASQSTGQRSSLCLTQSQGLPQVGNVIEALEFGHPAAQQEGEEVDEEAGVLADGEVGFVAHLLEPEPQVRGLIWQKWRTYSYFCFLFLKWVVQIS